MLKIQHGSLYVPQGTALQQVTRHGLCRSQFEKEKIEETQESQNY